MASSSAGSSVPPRTALTDDARLRLLRWTAYAFLVAFYVARVAGPLADLDMWHEMALTRDSLAAGHLLTVDVYAYTPTNHPLVDHEWGAGAILYFVALAAGGAGIVALKYLIALATALAVVWCAWQRRAGFEELTLLTPLAIPLFSLGCATLRAQAWSFLLFAVLLCLFEMDRAAGRGFFAAYPLLFALWVNLHGGCVVGLIALGAWWFEQVLRRERHRHLFAAAFLSFGALALNPYGLQYYRQLWMALRMPRPEITEWYPLYAVASNFHQTLFWISLAIAAAAVWGCGWRNARGLFILAAVALGSILHVRIVPFYAVAWAAFVPGYVAATPAAGFVHGLFRNRMAATLVCLTLSAFFAVMAFEVGFYRLVVPNDRYPVGAVRYLKELGFHGNVMTHFEHGGYVSWWLYPAVKVSIDSRYETAFPPEIVDESFRFYEARGDWRQILVHYPTDLALVPEITPVAKLMPGTGWQLIYRDTSFRIYARPGLTLPFRDASTAAFPETFP